MDWLNVLDQFGSQVGKVVDPIQVDDFEPMAVLKRETQSHGPCTQALGSGR